MRNKFILLVLLTSLFFTQGELISKDKWTLVEYEYSTGPVSPEYLYSMKIFINRDGTAGISYSTSGTSTVKSKEFRISKSKIRQLNYAIIKSRIMTVPVSEMKYEGEIIIGGQQRSVTLTVENTNPNLDQPPKKIFVSGQVKEQYSIKLNELFDLIELLVPASVLNEVSAKP
ncbi:MAG: hypothetical protein OZ913_05680 [Ignavibacteriaceae bacterium]|nr:hypothetical protein [Ignavibacteriaceae bacterium]